MNKKIKLFIPFFITLCIVLLFCIKRFLFLKFYPPCCNLFFFLVFFISLFSKKTVIQKIAETTDGKLSYKVKIYTRKLTYVWCIFTFINFVISLVTCFLSDHIWILYNGFISYIFMGTLFICEFVFRKILIEKFIP